ncbi:uncharacterized protein LOC121754415 [Salvia splendens]|uniref:uncharacterized protein LOC121754415 n=1 Tax=Salvia splendens TaxID=180675 RepID=UPI001C26B475|nr:uncharacterized protein LOC121754415 [Salvia splendens]
MGKKAWAKKVKGEKSTAHRREETPEAQPPVEARPPNPPSPAPVPQAPTMISLDAMAEFLRLQDPIRDWTAALAGFSQIRGAEDVTRGAPSEPNVQSMVQPTISIPIFAEILPERKSPSVTVLPESSETPQQSDSMEVDHISAHYDSDSDEREARKSREQGSLQGDDEPEKTPAAGTVSQGTAREEIDLDETAKKQGLMTDDEFQAILDRVNQREDDTATMVEDLNLTSRAVEKDEEGRAGEKEPESVNPQTEAGKNDVHVEAEETEARPEVPNPVAPPVTKLKAVKRKLVLKGEPEASWPKPQRRAQEHRREQSDSEYAVSEESESDIDISLENEECCEQQLPHDHRELSGGGDRIEVAEQGTGNSP